jgi:CUG-BP- and ETR3-like factor
VALVCSLIDFPSDLITPPVGPEGANLFILNLPPDHDDAQLRQLFAGYGNVLSTNVFKDRMTGISKQFGM